MLPGLRGLDRRLRRLAVRIEALKPHVDARAVLAEARRLVETTIRAGLARANIDPDGLPALRRLAEPEPLPGPATLPATSEGEADDPCGVLWARLEHLARQAREHPPTLSECSPAMLLAMVCCNGGVAVAPG